LKVHNESLRDVFARLKPYNLKPQPDKCEFLRREVLYLGHRLTCKGLLPDESELRAVKEFPIPNTTKKSDVWLTVHRYSVSSAPDDGHMLMMGTWLPETC